MAIFSVSDQFTNYFEYHQNPVNQLIHFVFVPVLTFSFILALSSVQLSSSLSPYINNVAFVLAILLSVYYILLDKETGAILSVMLFTFVFTSVYLYQVLPKSTCLFIFGATQLVGWTTQFAGHGIWEGRRPALADNIFQTLIAPLFVMLEALFFLGYKQDLKKEVLSKLQQRNEAKKKN